ncbi:ribonucleoside-triphosphate reductase [Cephaloticoccus capnophilus]|uniref:Ribonucleoside-triphosphate reductase n=1 Tax=Cephaloticoccus capnophilus TaxID=1548208 RepID=A0A139SKX2_9BACT|nr:anaerobic ribonucleoside-triphosphate reductase [Cephaloticoccus capnophilus]KXU35213.1 ribonucleoside-triphosphate reductase [Cephaloticoccus capnophilus]
MPPQAQPSHSLPRHNATHESYLSHKVKFIGDYLSAINAASGSKYDANANVTEKNLATLSGELFKGEIIKLNRYRLSQKIKALYGESLAKEYLRQLETHELYKHDESSIYPYCVTISMYPYLNNGLKEIGGLSAKPKNLDSFCGTFINLVFAVSAQFAGAVATGEYLLYFDYFARKDLGPDYHKSHDNFLIVGSELRKLITRSGKWFKNISELQNHDFAEKELNTLKERLLYEAQIHPGTLSDGTRTIDSHLTQKFQQVVYSLNQPAAARNYQSTFWNISYFDKNYFRGMFESFVFPDGSTPQWESVSWLQKRHMEWLNEERRKNVLTFPVETMAMLTDGQDIIDTEYADFSAQMYAKGHSFFTYLSDNPDSLASCCRLRNEIQDNTFSYTLGAGGIATGSKSVMTLNINRLVQNATRQNLNHVDYLRAQVLKIHKYQSAFNEILKEYYEDDALPIYKAGLISMEKQYLTIGINGMVEAAEFLGIPIKPCEEYRQFADSILKVFYEENRKARTKELMFNTEFVPAENLGVKHYKWDKEAGYVVPPTRNCYNSYYYASEDESLTLLDKFRLHGRDFTKYLDGGSALHMNLDHHLSKEQYRQILRIATVYGTNYFTFNIPNTLCNNCNHIDKRYLDTCPKCASHDVDYLTRVIGYLKRVSNFSVGRQTEARRRYYLGEGRVSLGKEK